MQGAFILVKRKNVDHCNIHHLVKEITENHLPRDKRKTQLTKPPTKNKIIKKAHKKNNKEIIKEINKKSLISLRSTPISHIQNKVEPLGI